MKLSKKQRLTLRLLGDDQWHPSTANPEECPGYVHGTTAYSLVKLKLAICRFHSPSQYKITTLGQEVLAALEQRGRQQTMLAPLDR